MAYNKALYKFAFFTLLYFTSENRLKVVGQFQANFHVAGDVPRKQIFHG